MKKLRIGFIGNFGVSYTTENERKWSFEKLGNEVIPFQENTTTADKIMERINDIDVLFYSHTHGWFIPNLKTVFENCSNSGKPVVSVHLDLWHGLERWRDVGTEATWFVDYLFMPVDEEWPEGIEVNYMRPGVVEKACYMAQPDKTKYPHDIIFVGSRGYHHEYPERPQLVDFLKKTYGNRFGLYGGDGYGTVREHELNVLYASAKVVVGDSCFSQSQKKINKYWSDRIPETTGRGGFLLHPKIDCPHEGVVWFDSLEDMKAKVDYYLQNDEEREELRLKGFEWTKKNANYTVIAREILEKIFSNG